MASDLSTARDRYHESVVAFIDGDADAQKPLWSQREDVTLANPLGPPVKGYQAVCQAMDAAATQVGEGDGYTFDLTSLVETADLAYEIGVETAQVRLGRSSEKAALSLRVTTIFRREDDSWKIVHRHADTTTAPRSIDTLQPDRAASR
jgi:ketosteroid isomerase-like protein